jgi:hypothetical protein
MNAPASITVTPVFVADLHVEGEAFDSVLVAQTVITDLRTIYNHRRPHSSLGWRLPAAYAASLTTNKSDNRPDSHSGRTDKRGPIMQRRRRDRSMQPPGVLPWSV